jgi:hypothetical protein
LHVHERNKENRSRNCFLRHLSQYSASDSVTNECVSIKTSTKSKHDCVMFSRKATLEATDQYGLTKSKVRGQRHMSEETVKP